jgi:integrase/recombinase XerD
MPTSHHSLRALRFLFLVTLRKPAIVLDMPFVREPRPLPVLLSPQEVARLLDAAPGLKYKAALSIAYGAGLRASEVATAPLAIPFGAARNAPSQATILPSNSTSFRDG